MIGKYNRKKNRDVTKEMVARKFGYDNGYEISVYKYLCGEKLKKDEMITLKENEDCYNSKRDWEKYQLDEILFTRR